MNNLNWTLIIFLLNNAKESFLNEISDLTQDKYNIPLVPKRKTTGIKKIENRFLTSTPADAKTQLRNLPSLIGKQKLSDIICLEEEDDANDGQSFDDLFGSVVF